MLNITSNDSLSVTRLFYKKFIIVHSILLFLLGITIANGQSVIINGTVRDTSNKSIVGATAKILQNDSSKLILAFDITDNNGKFKVKIDSAFKDGSILQISHINFESKNVLLYKNIQDEYIIILQPQSEDLPPVKVTSEMDITRRGDTTRFVVGKYEKGNEENIKSLLDRFPGMNVSSSGRIMFNGKSIERVLIEGDDLFNDRYEGLINNTGTSGLYKIEVIENYVDTNDISTNRNMNSNQTVLNLIYKQKKIRIFGDIKAGIGLPTKFYEFNSSNVAIVRNKKFVSNFNKNTTGLLAKNLINLSEDRLVNTNRPFLAASPVRILENIPDNIQPQRIFSNNSTFFTSNNKVSLFKGASIRSMVTILQDDFTQQFSNSTFFFTASIPISIIEQKQLKKRLSYFNLDEELFWKISTKLQTKVQARLLFNDNTDNQDNIINSIVSSQVNRLRNLHIEALSETFLKINDKHSLLAQAHIHTANFKNPFLFNGLIGDSLLQVPLEKFSSGYQSFNSRYYESMFNLKYALSLKKTIQSFALESSNILVNTNNQLSLGSTLVPNEFIHPSFTNNSHSTINKISAKYQIIIKFSSKFSTTLNTGLEKFKYTFTNKILDTAILSSKIQLDYKFTSKSNFLAMVTQLPILPDYYQLTNTNFLNSVNRASAGNGLLRIDNRYTFNVGYLFIDPIKTKLIANALISYTNNPVPYILNQNINIGFLTGNYMIFEQNNRFLTFSTRIERLLLKKKGSVVVNVNRTSAELFNMVSFTSFKTRVVNTNFDFQIKLSPTNSFTFRQNLIYQRNKQIDQSDNTLMNINLITRTKFEWFATKKFAFDFVFDVLHNRPDQQSTTTIFFADLNSKYQWSSKLSTFVACRNLFNQSAFTFNRITGFESNVSSFPLLERFLQLGITLKL